MIENNGYLNNSSLYDESIYSIKTAIKYNKNYSKCKVIGMTSSNPNEENIEILYDLAKTFAKDCLKVAILDFDLRMPKLGNIINPTQILDSKKIKELIENLSKEFDYIFINLPPVDLLADGSIISTYCDGIIVAVKYNDTKKEDLDKAIKNLQEVDANIIGLLMTHAQVDKNLYKSYLNK